MAQSCKTLQYKHINTSRDCMHADFDLHVFVIILGQNVRKGPHIYIATSQPLFSIVELLCRL